MHGTSDDLDVIPLSVVLPMHNTRESLDALVDRLAASCPARTELVFVDDACPQRSAAAVRLLRRNGPGRLVELSRGVGQHAAALIGLGAARGERIVIMDADLQDAPEDVPVLLAALDAAPRGVELVAAGRRGTYTGMGRQTTGRWYRALTAKLSSGRIPADAGMFCAMTGLARHAILDLGDPVAPLIPAAARAGIRVQSVPLERHARTDGVSSTTSRTRLRVAWRGIVTVTPLHRLAQPYRRFRWRPPDVSIVDLEPAQPELRP